MTFCLRFSKTLVRRPSWIPLAAENGLVSSLQLLTGSYILQAHRAKFNQFDVKPDCLLCGEEPETRSHFLVTCRSLQEQRTEPISQIQGILETCSDAQVAKEICTEELTCTHLLLDCTSKAVTDRIILTKEAITQIEHISQRLIFSLHMSRKSMLTLLAPGLKRKRGKTNLNAISLQPASTDSDSVLHTNTSISSTSRRVCHQVAEFP